jgi:hypothetical protein
MFIYVFNSPFFSESVVFTNERDAINHSFENPEIPIHVFYKKQNDIKFTPTFKYYLGGTVNDSIH